MKRIANCKLAIGNWKLDDYRSTIFNFQFSIFNFFLVAAASAFSASATVATAEPPRPPKIVGVRVGIADRYKAGLWTPVEVTLRGGDEPLIGEVAVIAPTATACRDG